MEGNLAMTAMIALPLALLLGLLFGRGWRQLLAVGVVWYCALAVQRRTSRMSGRPLLVARTASTRSTGGSTGPCNQSCWRLPPDCSGAAPKRVKLSATASPCAPTSRSSCWQAQKRLTVHTHEGLCSQETRPQADPVVRIAETRRKDACRPPGRIGGKWEVGAGWEEGVA